jgi:hypothetical protein
MFLDLRLEQLVAARPRLLESCCLIPFQKPTAAHHVRGEDGSETPIHCKLLPSNYNP